MTAQPDERALLAKQLGSRMRRYRPEASSHRFDRDMEDQRIEFHPDHRTFLCARLCAMACAASIDSEVAFVAAGCGAEIDPWPAGDALLSFRHPADALAAAIELSQLMGRTTLQIGLSTGQCRIASIADGDSQIQVAVGPAVDAASDACQMAPAGTVRMTAAAYAELQNSVANLRNCLVAAEYDHDGMEAVSLTFAPSASDALSTFAGLGLT